MMKVAMVKVAAAGLTAVVMVFAGIMVAGHLQAQPVATPGPIAQTEPTTKGNLPATAETAPADSPLATVRDLYKSMETLDPDAFFARLYVSGPDELAVQADIKHLFESAAQLKKALVAKFGDKPVAAMLPETLKMGLVSEAFLQNAEVQVTRDAATVTISPYRTLLMVKDKNLWKVKLASFMGGETKHEDVVKMHVLGAAKITRNDAIRLDVENGKLATLDDVTARLKEPLPRPAPPPAATAP